MHPFAVDWRTAFTPTVPTAEIVIRGTLVYLTLFGLMRFVLKREGGNVGLADLLMTVLVADAAQNAMAADYKSITDGLILVATIVFWNYALDWLAFRFRFLRRLIEPDPLKLVDNGKLLRRNMRRELISTHELFTHMREAGVEDLSEVKAAFMEGDGRISIVKHE
jgi:uncharacterized membrane protein YcaP (DUF421 family)